MYIESSIQEHIHPDLDTAGVTTLPQEHEDQDCPVVCAEGWTDRFEEELEHAETVLTGYSNMLSADELEYAALAGVEAYSYATLSLYGYSGMESWVENMKKGAEAAYKAIIETLKKIKEFFMGDGKRQADEASKKAEEAVNALAELDGNAPIPDEAKSRNPLSYFKGVQESVDLEELYAKHPTVKSALEKIEASVSRVKNAEVVSQMGAVYQDIRKQASAAAEVIGGVISKALRDGEAAANKMRKVDVSSNAESSPPEVQAAKKEEHKANVDEAKEQTKQSRLLASLRTKVVSTLNSLSSVAGSIKGEAKESEFKG